MDYKLNLITPSLYSKEGQSNCMDDLVEKFAHYLKYRSDTDFNHKCKFDPIPGLAFIHSFEDFEERFLIHSEYVIIIASPYSQKALNQFMPRLLVFLTAKPIWQNRFIFVILGKVKVLSNLVVNEPIEFSMDNWKDDDEESWIKLFHLIRLTWQPHVEDTPLEIMTTDSSRNDQSKSEEYNITIDNQQIIMDKIDVHDNKIDINDTVMASHTKTASLQTDVIGGNVNAFSLQTEIDDNNCSIHNVTAHDSQTESDTRNLMEPVQIKKYANRNIQGSNVTLESMTFFGVDGANNKEAKIFKESKINTDESLFSDKHIHVENELSDKMDGIGVDVDEASQLLKSNDNSDTESEQTFDCDLETKDYAKQELIEENEDIEKQTEINETSLVNFNFSSLEIEEKNEILNRNNGEIDQMEENKILSIENEKCQNEDGIKNFSKEINDKKCEKKIETINKCAVDMEINETNKNIQKHLDSIILDESSLLTKFDENSSQNKNINKLLEIDSKSSPKDNNISDYATSKIITYDDGNEIFENGRNVNNNTNIGSNAADTKVVGGTGLKQFSDKTHDNILEKNSNKSSVIDTDENIISSINRKQNVAIDNSEYNTIFDENDENINSRNDITVVKLLDTGTDSNSNSDLISDTKNSTVSNLLDLHINSDKISDVMKTGSKNFIVIDDENSVKIDASNLKNSDTGLTSDSCSNTNEVSVENFNVKILNNYNNEIERISPEKTDTLEKNSFKIQSGEKDDKLESRNDKTDITSLNFSSDNANYSNVNLNDDIVEVSGHSDLYTQFNNSLDLINVNSNNLLINNDNTDKKIDKILSKDIKTDLKFILNVNENSKNIENKEIDVSTKADKNKLISSNSGLVENDLSEISINSRNALDLKHDDDGNLITDNNGENVKIDTKLSEDLDTDFIGDLNTNVGNMEIIAKAMLSNNKTGIEIIHAETMDLLKGNILIKVPNEIENNKINITSVNEEKDFSCKSNVNLNDNTMEVSDLSDLNKQSNNNSDLNHGVENKDIDTKSDQINYFDLNTNLENVKNNKIIDSVLNKNEKNINEIYSVKNDSLKDVLEITNNEKQVKTELTNDEALNTTLVVETDFKNNNNFILNNTKLAVNANSDSLEKSNDEILDTNKNEEISVVRSNKAIIKNLVVNEVNDADFDKNETENKEEYFCQTITNFEETDIENPYSKENKCSDGKELENKNTDGAEKTNELYDDGCNIRNKKTSSDSFLIKDNLLDKKDVFVNACIDLTNKSNENSLQLFHSDNENDKIIKTANLKNINTTDTDAERSTDEKPFEMGSNINIKGQLTIEAVSHKEDYSKIENKKIDIGSRIHFGVDDININISNENNEILQYNNNLYENIEKEHKEEIELKNKTIITELDTRKHNYDTFNSDGIKNDIEKLENEYDKKEQRDQNIMKSKENETANQSMENTENITVCSNFSETQINRTDENEKNNEVISNETTEIIEFPGTLNLHRVPETSGFVLNYVHESNNYDNHLSYSPIREISFNFLSRLRHVPTFLWRIIFPNENQSSMEYNRQYSIDRENSLTRCLHSPWCVFLLFVTGTLASPYWVEITKSISQNTVGPILIIDTISSTILHEDAINRKFAILPIENQLK